MSQSQGYWVPRTEGKDEEPLQNELPMLMSLLAAKPGLECKSLGLVVEAAGEKHEFSCQTSAAYLLWDLRQLI